MSGRGGALVRFAFDFFLLMVVLDRSSRAPSGRPDTSLALVISLALASRRDASSRGGRPRPREASPKEWHRPRNEKTFHFDRLFATPGAEISHRCEF